jgi:hypothetical protein
MEDRIVDIKRVLQFSEKVLWISLIGILVLAALAFFFVFVINWEDWLFGTKLDGLPAGISLFAKSGAAMLLALLLLLFPKFRGGFAFFSVAYFGFLLADSATTIQKNTGGTVMFSPLLAVFFLVPVMYLIVHYSRGRFHDP